MLSVALLRMKDLAVQQMSPSHSWTPHPLCRLTVQCVGTLSVLAQKTLFF